MSSHKNGIFFYAAFAESPGGKKVLNIEVNTDKAVGEQRKQTENCVFIGTLGMYVMS